MKITYVDENGMKLAEPGCLPMVPLRDYFAAAALTGLLANPEAIRILVETYHQGYQNADTIMTVCAAQFALEAADAMLKARREDADTTK